MCLGIPGKVVRWLERQPPTAKAEIEFEGICRICNLSCVPEAQEGDYVIIHAGIAIARIDPLEAQRILEAQSALLEDDGWKGELE